MKTKTTKSKTPDENEKRFYQFARALMAVPKKEIDREPASHHAKREVGAKNQKKR